jgi:hypothetical protein
MPDGTTFSPIERIMLRRVTSRLAFADVRLPGVNLHGLRIEESDAGALTIRAPWHIDSSGREWPHFALQPYAREALEREIARLWSASRTD